ncbi:hypothetical protein Efla_006672 [Eimeria flavescens]
MKPSSEHKENHQQPADTPPAMATPRFVDLSVQVGPVCGLPPELAVRLLLSAPGLFPDAVTSGVLTEGSGELSLEQTKIAVTPQTLDAAARGVSVHLVEAASAQKEGGVVLARGHLETFPLLHDTDELDVTLPLTVCQAPASPAAARGLPAAAVGAAGAPAAAAAAAEPPPAEQQQTESKQQQQQHHKQPQAGPKGGAKETPAAAAAAAGEAGPALGDLCVAVSVSVKIRASSLLGAPEDSQDFNILSVTVEGAHLLPDFFGNAAADSDAHPFSYSLLLLDGCLDGGCLQLPDKGGPPQTAGKVQDEKAEGAPSASAHKGRGKGGGAPGGGAPPASPQGGAPTAAKGEGHGVEGGGAYPQGGGPPSKPCIVWDGRNEAPTCMQLYRGRRFMARLACTLDHSGGFAAKAWLPLDSLRRGEQHTQSLTLPLAAVYADAAAAAAAAAANPPQQQQQDEEEQGDFQEDPFVSAKSNVVLSVSLHRPLRELFPAPPSDGSPLLTALAAPESSPAAAAAAAAAAPAAAAAAEREAARPCEWRQQLQGPTAAAVAAAAVRGVSLVSCSLSSILHAAAGDAAAAAGSEDAAEAAQMGIDGLALQVYRHLKEQGQLAGLERHLRRIVRQAVRDRQQQRKTAVLADCFAALSDAFNSEIGAIVRTAAAETERQRLFLAPEEATAATAAAPAAAPHSQPVAAAEAASSPATAAAAAAAETAGLEGETEQERLCRLRFECEIVGDLEGAVGYHKQLLLLPAAAAAAAATTGPLAAAAPSEGQLYVQLAALLLRADEANADESELALREAVLKFGGLKQTPLEPLLMLGCLLLYLGKLEDSQSLFSAAVSQQMQRLHQQQQQQQQLQQLQQSLEGDVECGEETQQTDASAAGEAAGAAAAAAAAAGAGAAADASDAEGRAEDHPDPPLSLSFFCLALSYLLAGDMDKFEAALCLSLQPAGFHAKLLLDERLLLPEAAAVADERPPPQQQEQQQQQQQKMWSEWAQREIEQQFPSVPADWMLEVEMTHSFLFVSLLLLLLKSSLGGFALRLLQQEPLIPGELRAPNAAAAAESPAASKSAAAATSAAAANSAAAAESAAADSAAASKSAAAAEPAAAADSVASAFRS